MNWLRDLKGKVRRREPLKKHTSFKIGGPAEFFIEPKNIADLKILIAGAKKSNIPLLVIGAGSNILVKDPGVHAMVARLSSSYFRGVSCRRNFLDAGCGLTLRQLILAAKKHGLSGVEFLAGIPGTVGGALAMNAGAWGRSILDLVEKASVMDYNGTIKTLDKKEIKFNYRKSSLAKYIILGARLRLVKESKAMGKDNIETYLGYRRDTQDFSLPNAGCIFKNPGKKSAGKLIDLCGLKGRRIGNALVSLKHANFILNQGNAKASDVLQLMGLIKKRVKQKFNVSLEPEIKIWE